MKRALFSCVLVVLLSFWAGSAFGWSWLEDFFKKSSDNGTLYLETKKGAGLKVTGPINATGGIYSQTDVTVTGVRLFPGDGQSTFVYPDPGNTRSGIYHDGNYLWFVLPTQTDSNTGAQFNPAIAIAALTTTSVTSITTTYETTAFVEPTQSTDYYNRPIVSAVTCTNTLVGSYGDYRGPYNMVKLFRKNNLIERQRWTLAGLKNAFKNPADADTAVAISAALTSTNRFYPFTQERMFNYSSWIGTVTPTTLLDAVYERPFIPMVDSGVCFLQSVLAQGSGYFDNFIRRNENYSYPTELEMSHSDKMELYGNGAIIPFSREVVYTAYGTSGTPTNTFYGAVPEPYVQLSSNNMQFPVNMISSDIIHPITTTSSNKYYEILTLTSKVNGGATTGAVSPLYCSTLGANGSGFLFLAGLSNYTVRFVLRGTSRSVNVTVAQAGTPVYVVAKLGVVKKKFVIIVTNAKTGEREYFTENTVANGGGTLGDAFPEGGLVNIPTFGSPICYGFAACYPIGVTTIDGWVKNSGIAVKFLDDNSWK